MSINTLKYLTRLYERTRTELSIAIADRKTIEKSIHDSGENSGISEKFPEYYVAREKIEYNKGRLRGIKTAIINILETDELENQ